MNTLFKVCETAETEATKTSVDGIQKCPFAAETLLEISQR